MSFFSSPELLRTTSRTSKRLGAAGIFTFGSAARYGPWPLVRAFTAASARLQNFMTAHSVPTRKAWQLPPRDKKPPFSQPAIARFFLPMTRTSSLGSLPTTPTAYWNYHADSRRLGNTFLPLSRRDDSKYWKQTLSLMPHVFHVPDFKSTKYLPKKSPNLLFWA